MCKQKKKTNYTNTKLNEQALDDRLELIYNSFVWTQEVV